MRPIHIVAMLASLAFLSGCATAHQTEATAPTVSYTYDDDDDHDIVEKKADLYCEQQYDKDAVLVDRDVESDGYEATFACK